MGFLGFIHRINWVDIIVITLLIRSSYIGWRRGLIGEIFAFLGIIAALFISIYYYNKLAQFLSAHSFLTLAVAGVISFLGLVILTLIAFKLLNKALQVIVKIRLKGAFERAGGLILGFSQGCILSSLLVLALVLLPSSYAQNSVKEKSVLGKLALKLAPTLYQKVAKIPPEAIETFK